MNEIRVTAVGASGDLEYLTYNMWLYCGHFQQHKQLWLLGWIGNCLMWWVIVICASQFIISKLQNRSWDAKAIGRQSEDSLSLIKAPNNEHLYKIDDYKLKGS